MGEPRAWKDCPTCEGQGQVSEELDYYRAQFCDWGPWPAFDGDKSKHQNCPTCAAHFAEVDAADKAGYERGVHESVLDDSDITAARAEGVREAVEKCRGIVDNPPVSTEPYDPWEYDGWNGDDRARDEKEKMAKRIMGAFDELIAALRSPAPAPANKEVKP